MARFRSIDSDIWQHPAFRRAPLHVREVFLYLFSCAADDEGRFVADPEAILEGAFGRRHPVDVEDIVGALSHLQADGLVLLYDEGRHGCLLGWYEHQCPAKDRRSLSRLPEPPTEYPSWLAVEAVRVQCANALGRSMQQVSYRDAMVWGTQHQLTADGASTERQRSVDGPSTERMLGSGSGSGSGSTEGAAGAREAAPLDPHNGPTAPPPPTNEQATARRLDLHGTAHDTADGALPPDCGMLLSNNPDIAETAKHLLPEWTQPQRDALVCQIGTARRDPATIRVVSVDTWPELLRTVTPTLDQRARPAWWVEDRVKDARKAAEREARARASPSHSGPIPPSRDKVDVDEWGQVIVRGS